MRGPSSFIEHLRENQYHPRSDAHSNAICRGILMDLIDHCPPIAQKAAAGELVGKINHTVTVNYQRWNIDLALGPPSGRPEPPPDGELIRDEAPSLIEIAIEAKGVMTEHGKARHNRLRDLHAFHGHAHLHNEKTIAVGIVVVNVSPIFWSPTRPAHDISFHENIERLGQETVDLYRGIPLRNRPDDRAGLEALAVLAIEHDNLPKNENLPINAPAPTESVLVSKAPAPKIGDPLHYSTLIQRVCRAYQDRWV
jgi:hypothetical protein